MVDVDRDLPTYQTHVENVDVIERVVSDLEDSRYGDEIVARYDEDKEVGTISIRFKFYNR
jgi:hypothetical protein